MTSLINPQNIDITYPIAGQDNDTQGFRTNFRNIKNNFVVASQEITTLQQGNTAVGTFYTYANIHYNYYTDSNVSAYLPTYAGNLTSGNTTVGNLINSGTRIEAGYQYYAPTTNFTYTVNNNVSLFILDPTGAITNGNILLPSSNVDATVVTISSTQTVTNFKVTPNNGTTLVPSANVVLTGGTGVKYFYHAVESKWYKIG